MKKTENANGSLEKIRQLYEQPFNDLLFQAHTVHRQNHDPNALQWAALLNFKTGACPEDCGYCGQSGHYNTHVKKEKMMSVEGILAKAQEARAQGASRFCMGAAWRSPPKQSMEVLAEIIQGVNALGLETCMTLGMLNEEQAQQLKAAGLMFYNHNIDTSPEYYAKVATTRKFTDRLETIENVHRAGMQVCSGGIVGLGETREDRIAFLETLANLPSPPESIPINRLIPVAGTPLAQSEQVEGIELVRTIATARLLMPKSAIRLTAGRAEMGDELQAWCFFAGANSIFIGSKLLTEANPQLDKDRTLLAKLGLTVNHGSAHAAAQ